MCTNRFAHVVICWPFWRPMPRARCCTCVNLIRTHTHAHKHHSVSYLISTSAIGRGVCGLVLHDEWLFCEIQLFFHDTNITHHFFQIPQNSTYRSVSGSELSTERRVVFHRTVRLHRIRLVHTHAHTETISVQLFTTHKHTHLHGPGYSVALHNAIHWSSLRQFCKDWLAPRRRLNWMDGNSDPPMSRQSGDQYYT